MILNSKSALYTEKFVTAACTRESQSACSREDRRPARTGDPARPPQRAGGRQETALWAEAALPHSAGQRRDSSGSHLHVANAKRHVGSTLPERPTLSTHQHGSSLHPEMLATWKAPRPRTGPAGKGWAARAPAALCVLTREPPLRPAWVPRGRGQSAGGADSPARQALEPSAALNRPPASSGRCGERQNLSGGSRGNGYSLVFYFDFDILRITTVTSHCELLTLTLNLSLRREKQWKLSEHSGNILNNHESPCATEKGSDKQGKLSAAPRRAAGLICLLHKKLL